MIEAALLALELFFVILLLFAINKASKPEAEKNLGIFGFRQTRSEANLTLEQAKNGKNKKKATTNA